MTQSQKDPAKFRSSIRIGMHEYFLEMALASFELYQGLSDGLISDKAEGGYVYGEEPKQHFTYNKHSEITWAEQQIVLEIIKAIIFLNMYCEAYIWDLAATILGDKYAKKHLDKLDTLSKWIIIPKLLFGRQIDEGHHSVGILKELIKLRNDFVHSKSKDGAAFVRNPQDYPGELVALEEKINLYEIFDGIKDLFLQLNSVDPGNSHCLNFKRGLSDRPGM